MSDVVRAVTFDVNDTVSEVTLARLAEAVPDTTIRAYRAAWARFTRWCAGEGRDAVPCTAATLAEYTRHLTDEGLAPATMHLAIAAIQREHRVQGVAKPDTLAALTVLRGYKRQRADEGKATRQAAPLSLSQLRDMVDACPDTVVGRRDQLILVLGVSAMLRRSELSALRWEDVIVTAEGLLVRIRASKTDREGAGVVVPVPLGQRRGTCPVDALTRYAQALGETSGPLLRRLSKGGKPLSPLSADAVNDVVRRAAERAGVPHAERITAHSLRATGATLAAKAGAPVSTITTHGRWAAGSPVVHTDVRQADRWSDNPMHGTGL